MLGSHSSAGYVGEVKRLVRKPEKACYICQDQPSCELLGGIGIANLPDLYRILYARMEGTKTLLVDNSKKTSWAARYLALASEFDLRFVHLIRDPRALVRRWHQNQLSLMKGFRYRKRGALHYPLRAVDVFFKPLHFAYALRWLRQNEEITQFLAKHKLNHQIVTYRDLATTPDQQLKNLMGWLDLEYEPAQRNYWNFAHHGTQKKDYVSNNSDLEGYIDLRWQDDLSAQVQTEVIQLAEVQRYLASIHLNLLDDGLSTFEEPILHSGQGHC